MTVITAFEVPPEADERFLAGLDDLGAATLHRALRADVRFRFVAIADSEHAPGAPHSGRYEVVRVDGAPDTEGGAILISLFEVAEEDDERFLAAWEAARAVLRAQQGHLGARLHRSVGPAEFRFVELARWSSPLMYARSLAREEVHAAALPFPSQPALYQVVRE